MKEVKLVQKFVTLLFARFPSQHGYGGGQSVGYQSLQSLVLNCKDFALNKNGGIVKLAFLVSNKSCIKKPLSAITLSPSVTSNRNPLCLVISLSDILP